MTIPTILVVFGATGDLMERKVIPTLYYLYLRKQLPALFSVIGFSRRKWSDVEFRGHVKQALVKHRHGSGSIPEDFLKIFHYQEGTFEQNNGYEQLAKRLGHIDREHLACANKLYYLAVPPAFYETIFLKLNRTGLAESCGPGGGWTRVLIEKPFGRDLKSAQKLDQLLRQFFSEDQIYRIDHYLAKEMIQGIINFRFSNRLFEPQWNNQSIERIDVKLLETIGVEGRGTFYDAVGALRDVGQNHLLQMLALVTMNNPRSQAPADIQAKRAQVLQTLVPLTEQEILSSTFRAQFDGYRKVEGVKPSSQTETYFKVKARLDHPRWEGVPIILEGGKRLKDVCKEIVVTFKHPTPCLLCSPGRHYQNKVVFTLEPAETITIYFWAKKPGERKIEQRHFTFFLYEKFEKAQYVEEYSRLLLDAIFGDQTLYVSSDEVEAMWRFIDPIIAGWNNNLVTLHTYRPGSDDILAKADNLIEQQAAPKTAIARHMGMVGLGKMGANFTRQLLEKGWQVTGFDQSAGTMEALVKEGLDGVSSLQEVVEKLPRPRIIWLMVPQGKPVDDTLASLLPLLEKGDIIIDGGNSYYKDSIRRAKQIVRQGIEYVDVGVSGGPEGARAGASLMVGGKWEIYELLQPLYADLATPEGCAFFAGAGAGHFVKMIHNGIEYGMMQAIAEGFTMLKQAPYKLDLAKVAEVYNHGGVVESRLISWLQDAFQLRGQDLSEVSGLVAHTGEGAWTVKEAKARKIKAKVIEEALKFRIQSQRNPSYTGKILSALREQFGGHKVK